MEIQEEMKSNRKGKYSSLLHNEGARGVKPPLQLQSKYKLLTPPKTSNGPHRWLSSKESACQVGDLHSSPRLGRSPEEGYGNLLQYSCLGNSIDRGAWWATVHGVERRDLQLYD